jgi:hypothetical protein
MNLRSASPVKGKKPSSDTRPVPSIEDVYYPRMTPGAFDAHFQPDLSENPDPPVVNLQTVLDELERLRADNNQLRDALELSPKRDAAPSVSTPVSSNNELLQALQTLLTRPSASSDAPASSSRALPDPEPLSDGKSPEYESWESRMISKLASNKRDYSTEQQKIAYIQSRLTGKADSLTTHRFSAHAAHPYRTSQDVFDHLQALFLNKNKRQEAKSTYQLLTQKSTPFPEFYSQFLYLASQGGIPEVMWKEDLIDKITPSLRRVTYAEQMDPALSYQGFADLCTMRDYQIRKDRELTQAPCPALSQPVTNLQTRPAARTVTSAVPGSQVPRAERSYEDRKAYNAQRSGGVNNCAYCKEEGHWLRDCPKRAARNQSTIALVQSTSATVPVAGSDNSLESGKDRAST